MTIRVALLVLLAGTAPCAQGQVRVDRPIVFDGPTDADRQVIGLGDGGGQEDALNARTLRDAPYRYAEVDGGSTWTVDLQPPLTGLTAGTALVLRSGASSSGPVTITVNGMGPYAVLKGNGSPLGTDDVGAGEMAHVVFDGSAFQLVGSRRLDKRPCPPNTVQANPQYCIEITETDTLMYTEAAVVCGERNGRLCTWGEWYGACVQAQALGLQQMSGNYEWTNSAANGDGNVRVSGSTSCSATGTGPAWVAPGRVFRCCYRR